MTTTPTPAPGAEIGLPAHGPGSLAGWGRRLAALVFDWATSMLIASLLVGPGAVRGHDWRAWTVLGVYFLQKTVLTASMGGSLGQLLARIGVMRLGALPIGWWRSAARAALHCLVLPSLVIGPHRRGLDDIILGTVVVNRV